MNQLAMQIYIYSLKQSVYTAEGVYDVHACMVYIILNSQIFVFCNIFLVNVFSRRSVFVPVGPEEVVEEVQYTEHTHEPVESFKVVVI